MAMHTSASLHKVTSESTSSTSASTFRTRRWPFSKTWIPSRADRATRPSTLQSNPHDDVFDPTSGSGPSRANLQESADMQHRQLLTLTAKMRHVPSDPNHVDSAYEKFVKVKDECATLCVAILSEDARPPRNLSSPHDTLTRRDSSVDSPSSPSLAHDGRSSFSGRSFGEAMTQMATRTGTHFNEAYLAAIRDWKQCLEILADAFKKNLAETYKSYARDATPEMVEALFASKRFRKDAINKMRNASVTRMMSANPEFFPRYDIRFRNYEKVKTALIEIRQLLQAAESGISPSRHVVEFPVEPAGDVILEFANLGEHSTTDPVLRFRVSSERIRVSSPIFARMCSGPAFAMRIHEDGDLTSSYPPPAIDYVSKDGSKAKLFRMPQHELNRHQALEIMLYAAHERNSMVPKDITFEQFVAIAECSLTYKCTSPLEHIVEHEWLPQWLHNGADEMPDGMLIISYAFGLRQLFTRMSKTAILNITNERELQNRPWPQVFKDKIWAVRCAKMDQIYRCCADAIREYIKPATRLSPANASAQESEARHRFSPAAQRKPNIAISSLPRCPKGSHSCDAINLGWLTLVFNEMHILEQIMRPELLSHLPETEHPSISVATLIDSLRRIPGPDAPIHRGGVCDPCPAFRSVMTDILNSVMGLTLYDISGKSHGWALSKNRVSEPQALLPEGLSRMAAHDDRHSVVTEFPEIVRLRILSELTDLRDLHSAARINRAFYDTYKVHELYLMRGIARLNQQVKRPVFKPGEVSVEPKCLSDEAHRMKEETLGLGADAYTLNTVGSSDEYNEDDDSDTQSDTTADHVTGGYDAGSMGNPSTLRTDELGLGSHTSSPGMARSTRPARSMTNGKPTVIHDEFVHSTSQPMSEEEIERILWGKPEASATPRSPIDTLPPSGQEPVREKFLVGDVSFRSLEGKSVTKMEDKQLRSEYEQAILFKKGIATTEGGSPRKQT